MFVVGGMVSDVENSEELPVFVGDTVSGVEHVDDDEETFVSSITSACSLSSSSWPSYVSVRFESDVVVGLPPLFFCGEGCLVSMRTFRMLSIPCLNAEEMSSEVWSSCLSGGDGDQGGSAGCSGDSSPGGLNVVRSCSSISSER